MSNVYKINLFTYKLDKDDPKTNAQYKDFCINKKDNNKGYIGWGWKLPVEETVTSIETFKQKHKESYGTDRALSRACNQIKDMEPGDLCWTYYDKHYWIGMVEGDFCFGTPNKDYPAFGMYRRCNWQKIITTDFVPGEVTAYSQKDGTVLCLTTNNETNDAHFNYCKWLYENPNATLNTTIPKDKKGCDFWKLAHYEDLEDLVGMYLQKEESYYVFPSTNKQSTPDYEYKLVKNDGSNFAIIQCKNNTNLDKEKWSYFEQEAPEDVCILTIKDDPHLKDNGYDTWKMGWKKEFEKKCVYVFDPDKLKEWAINNTIILPLRIQKFLECSKPASSP